MSSDHCLHNTGYDGGVTGGIIVMEGFAREFFPKTMDIPDTNFYCKYDDKLLQTFASIMHFTGALAAFPAGYFTAKYGRTRSGPTHSNLLLRTSAASQASSPCIKHNEL